jgi:hypothetical protein
MQDRTLTRQVSESTLVVLGTLGEAKSDTDGDGTTEMRIDTVIKKHDILGDKKVVTLARYIPALDKDSKYLVLCDVFKGRVDPLFVLPVKASSNLGDYLKGAMEIKDKPAQERLKFFAKYLDDADIEASTDAFKEFSIADNKDVKVVAKAMSADKIAGWLEDANTPGIRHGVYAMMLGYAGGDSHAKRLRALLDDPRKRLTGFDGMLAGYILLKPKEGWQYLRELLKDPSHEFMQRYAGLRTARFFHNTQPDLVAPKDVVEAVTLLLDQADIADLAIEDLRKWACWDEADRVLSLYAQKSHDIPIIRRSILRYALQCPGDKAATFVADLRKRNKQMVEDAEELLKLEAPPPAKAASK